MKEIFNKKILIVDDEAELLKLLKNCLLREGFYHIYTASTCAEASMIQHENNIALFVLDVNLPDGSGFDLYRDFRAVTDSPAIFLTARGGDSDRVYGLGLGADDYIVKPFLMKEFALRVLAVLKRAYRINYETACIKLSDRTVDLDNAVVNSPKGEIALTAKEAMLLRKLNENKNRIVTNDALCLAVWGDDYYGYENTLMVHIRRLREKTEVNPSKPRHIITAKGLGYKFVIENEKNDF